MNATEITTGTEKEIETEIAIIETGDEVAQDPEIAKNVAAEVGVAIVTVDDREVAIKSIDGRVQDLEIVTIKSTQNTRKSLHRKGVRGRGRLGATTITAKNLNATLKNADSINIRSNDVREVEADKKCYLEIQKLA